jgi:RHS repeat-associated protein
MEQVKYIRYIFSVLVLLSVITPGLYSQCNVSGSTPSSIRFYGNTGETEVVELGLSNWQSGCELELSYESYLDVQQEALTQLTVTLLSDITEIVQTSITVSVFGDEKLQIPVLISPALTGGTIGILDASVVCNTSPGTFSNEESAFGEDGTYSYQWQKSTDGGVTWSTITGATNETYTCPALTATTCFRRKVTSNSVTAYSNVLTIVVYVVQGIASENYVIKYAPQSPVTTESQLEAMAITQLSPSIQYVDGLGRTEQNITVAASPTGNDIVQPVVYDEYGREKVKLLPYTLSNTGNRGAYQDNIVAPGTTGYTTSAQYLFYTDSDNENNGLVQDSYPYSEAELEDSPLNRVIQQGAPGADWQIQSTAITNSGHTVKSDYEINGESEVRMFNVENDELTDKGYYPAGRLYKTITKDENWSNDQTYPVLNTAEEYKDKSGQLILKRTYVEDGVDSDELPDIMDTYYVYDDIGLLRYVLPPEAVNQMYNSSGISLKSFKLVSTPIELSAEEDGVTAYSIATGGGITLKPGYGFSATTDESLSISAGNTSSDLIYYYSYDGKKRMIEKKLPGAAPVYMVYDMADHLVATQDGNMRDPDNDGDESDAQWLFTKYDVLSRPVATGIFSDARSRANLQTAVNQFRDEDLYEERGSARHGYTNRSFPTSPVADDYLTVTYYDDYTWKTSTDIDTYFTSLVSQFSTHGFSNVTVPTISKFGRVRGQVTGTKVKVLDGNSTWLESMVFYDDHYRTILKRSANYVGGEDIALTKYDFVGKAIENWNCHTTNLTATSKRIIRQVNTYDHAGRLRITQQQMTGAPQLVTIVLNTYNELGQLMYKTVGNGIEEMNYAYNIRGWLTQINDPDNVATSTKKFSMRLHYKNPVTSLSAQGQYNGNISSIEWRTVAAGDISGDKHGYGYAYDANNRLRNAYFGIGDALARNTGFDESITGYDMNGNITGLTRNKTVSSTNYTIDNLSYSYSGNQLLSVTDNAPAIQKSQGFYDVSGSLDYTYDLNGNLTADKNKDISLIKYNYLNLPEKIVNQTDINKTIEYIYSADGQKLMKKSPDNIKTYYSGSFVYETASGATTLKYIIHPEGMISMSSTPEYQYYLKDHLGNVRMVVNSSNVTTQITNYYSFGLSSESYTSGFDNKYLYNGKELQEDGFNSNSSLGWFDYGKRFYDPVIGRFPSLDPLADKFNWVSPYNYAENSPITNLDFWGLQAVSYLQPFEYLPFNSFSNASYDCMSFLSNTFAVQPINGAASLINYAADKFSVANEYGLPAAATDVMNDFGNFEANFATPVTGKDVISGFTNPHNWEFAIGSLACAGMFKNPFVAEESFAAKTGTTIIEDVAVHGNSLKSMKPTWGYKLFSEGEEFLKNGITSKLIPETRYTKAFMSDKYMEAIPFPNRQAAYDWEYLQNQILRGPLNLNMH